MVLIFSLIFVNLLLWNIFVPVFELPSEQLYFHRVQEIYDHKQLPNLLRAEPGDLSYPDTYPVLLTPVIGLFNPPPIFYPQTRTFNPEVITVIPPRRGTYNRFIHPPAEQRLNWNSFQWSVHAMRFLTSLIYLLAIWITYKTTRSYATLLFIGFLPKMIHRAASLVNLPLLFLSFSLFYYLVLTRRPSRITSLFLGLTAGLGVITKITGYNLVLFFILYWLIFVKSNRLSNLVTFITGFLSLSGWYFLRNWFLYGNPIISILPNLEPPLPSEAIASLGNQFNYWYTVVFNTFRTFWDGFGWENLIFPRFVHWLINLFTLMALFQFIFDWPKSTTKIKFLAASLLLYTATFLFINLKFFTPQGKDFMPMLLPISLIYISGLRRLWQPLPLRLLPFILFTANTLFLLLSVTPKTLGQANISTAEYYHRTQPGPIQRWLVSTTHKFLGLIPPAR